MNMMVDGRDTGAMFQEILIDAVIADAHSLKPQ